MNTLASPSFNSGSSYVVPVLAALAVHLFVAWLFAGGLDSWLPRKLPEPKVYKVVQASLVQAPPVKQAAPVKPVVKPVKKTVSKPKAPPKKTAKPVSKTQTVKTTAAEAKPKPAAAPVDPTAGLDALFADEDAALQQDREQDEVARYSAAMTQLIEQNWSRPPSARNNMAVLLEIRLVPTGDVVGVSVKKSSGNMAVDRAAVLAVEKIGRFEFLQGMPIALFEKNFRTMTFNFNPQDLRL